MHKHTAHTLTGISASTGYGISQPGIPTVLEAGMLTYASVNTHKAQDRTGVGAKCRLSKLQADTPRRQFTHTTHQDTISGTLQALLLAGAAAKNNAVVSHLGLVAGHISQPDRGRESVLKPPQALASFFWQTGQPKRLQRSFADKAGEEE